MPELADLSAAELLRFYGDGSLSPVEVTAAVLARIEACEPKLCAMFALDTEGARAAAADSERRWHSRAARPLEGVPVTIKENVARKGVPMPLGTAARALTPMPADGPATARLREAGAVILGGTTMPDFGMLSSGLSSFHRLARNPWDLSANPGGSSAGAAAAAAAGYGPLHIGTDIGGSIRLPAGWCGLVGLKPSFGRVPVDPPYYGRVVGPMTRTVTDAALMMREISRPDARDHMSLPPADLTWLDLDRDLRGLRFGLMMEAGIGLPLDGETRAAVAAVAQQIADAGGIVEPMPSFLTRAMLDGLDDFWRARSWNDISALAPEAQERVLPYIRRWAEGGASLSGAQVYRGMHQMYALREAALKASSAFDFLLMPTAPNNAFPAEWAGPTNDPARPFEHIVYTVAFNMSDQPAVSINCGFTAGGFPIGLQIVGQRFDDVGVLRVARSVETMRGNEIPWPKLA
jgi:aspartyl-tRNA(Asn)/glutamyl-tRNA(Gln) amidotransferase subunit A